MFNDFQKVALITGSAQRIGSHIAEKLANDGWSIAIHYNSSEKKAYSLAKQLLKFTNVDIFKADLTCSNETKNLIPRIYEKLGKIKLLINNASIYKNDNLKNCTERSLLDNFSIHLFAPILLSQTLARESELSDIINILDTDISNYPKNFFSYNLSKKSLAELSNLLAINLAPNVRVNSIAPGPTLFKEGQNLELFNRIFEESPLKTKTTLEEIYSTIQFILNSTSITGQIFYLDGGRHLL